MGKKSKGHLAQSLSRLTRAEILTYTTPFFSIPVCFIHPSQIRSHPPTHARHKAAPSPATPHCATPSPPPLAAQHPETHGPPRSHRGRFPPPPSPPVLDTRKSNLRTSPASLHAAAAPILSGPLPRLSRQGLRTHPRPARCGSADHPSAKGDHRPSRVRTGLARKQPSPVWT